MTLPITLDSFKTGVDVNWPAGLLNYGVACHDVVRFRSIMAGAGHHFSKRNLFMGSAACCQPLPEQGPSFAGGGKERLSNLNCERSLHPNSNRQVTLHCWGPEQLIRSPNLAHRFCWLQQASACSAQHSVDGHCGSLCRCERLRPRGMVVLRCSAYRTGSLSDTPAANPTALAAHQGRLSSNVRVPTLLRQPSNCSWNPGHLTQGAGGWGWVALVQQHCHHAAWACTSPVGRVLSAPHKKNQFVPLCRPPSPSAAGPAQAAALAASGRAASGSGSGGAALRQRR